MSSFTRAIFLAILVEIVLSQSSPPAVGIQLSSAAYPDWDVRFPLTVTQCEPVFIYCNNSRAYPFSGVELHNTFETINGGILDFLFIGYFPLGVGYFEWICNIPAGYSFWARSIMAYPFVVQPGSSSSCLRNITTTYQYYISMHITAPHPSSPIPRVPRRHFHPLNLQRRTLAPILVAFLILTSVSLTVPFPTGSFSTITVKCENPLLLTDIWNHLIVF